MERIDVIVVGLGGIGSAAAYHLARRGHRVLGLDALHPPHDIGSSHGGSRLIRQAYFEHPDYVPLLLAAYSSWRRLEAASGRSLIATTGALMIGPPDSEVVAGSLATADRHDLEHELLDAAALTRRFPPLQPAAGTVALFEQVAGVLSPERCVEAHLEGAVAVGARLRLGESVESWRRAGEGIEVVTSVKRYRAARLVLACGPWATEVVGDLQLPLTVSRKVSLWPQPAGGVERFLPGELPVWIWQPAGEEAFYGFPALDGPAGGVKVAIHTGVDPCAPGSVDRELRVADVEAVRCCLATRVPTLAAADVVRHDVCLYTHTPDDHCVLGLHPADSRVVLAAGFSGHGFKFAALFGEVLADLAVDGGSRHAIDLFAPGRFAQSV